MMEDEELMIQDAVRAAFDCNRAGDCVGWQDVMAYGVQLFLEQTAVKYKTISASHILDTPSRVTRAMAEFASGCCEDPRVHLKKTFTNGDYDQLIMVQDIRMVSLCAHHLQPIVGKIDFGYIPGDFLVGLSKIPRFIQVLAKRPQVQEQLSEEIVDIFQDTVQPKGCGVFIRGFHGCMMWRGVNEPQSFTRTNALRGSFKSCEATRLEFLNAIDQSRPIFP